MQVQGVVIDVYSPGEGAALMFPDGSRTSLHYQGGRFWGTLTPWRVDVDGTVLEDRQDMAECWARRVFGGPRGHEAATDEDMKLFDECCEAIKRSGNTGA
jgi:hypothetical protein